MSASDGSGFRPRGRIEEPVHRLDREGVAGHAARRYRARDGFEVLLAEQVLERALVIGRARAPLEWVGLLVGRLCEDDVGRFVMVLGMVLDEDAVAGPHTVRTTTTSEARTRALARALFPDCGALGWIHGHIRHGVIYSAVDRDNQRSWRQPHAVGIVVDPWSPERLSVYRGPDSERLTAVELTERGTTARPSTRSATTPSTPRDRSTSPEHTPSPRKRANVLCEVAELLLVSLLGMTIGREHALDRRIAWLEARSLWAGRPPVGVAQRPSTVGALDRCESPPRYVAPVAPTAWPSCRSTTAQRTRVTAHESGRGGRAREGRGSDGPSGDRP